MTNGTPGLKLDCVEKPRALSISIASRRNFSKSRRFGRRRERRPFFDHMQLNSAQTRSTIFTEPDLGGQTHQMIAPHYNSFLEQTFHYFARPHEGVPNTPVPSAAAWAGPELTAADWRVEFSTLEVEELERAIKFAHGTQKPLDMLGRDDFPLPGLETQIALWRRELAFGRGFQVLSGLPVEKWSEADASVFFWCFGLHLGRPGAQNRKGDLLGHVRDTGADKSDPFVRQYMTTQNIPFHCDAADVVGLLCVKKAKSGGMSRIASSVSVFNEILRRRPDLAPLLFEPFMLDARDESEAAGAQFLPIPPCQYSGGILRTFYHAEYFRTSQRHEGVALTLLQNELLNLYDEIATSESLRLDMALEPGDIQLLSNHTVVHARSDYEDYPEPERKRHLLRLWLSIENEND
jgi:hypothetical protein